MPNRVNVTLEHHLVGNQSPRIVDWLLKLGAARVACPVFRGGGGSDTIS
jgi:hypothetical protein